MAALLSRMALFGSVVLVSACTQGQMAEVYNKGNQFFGRVDVPSNMAMRMPQNPSIAAKYQASQPEFSTAAAVDGVETKVLDLPPPAPAAAPAAKPVQTITPAKPQSSLSAPKTQSFVAKPASTQSGSIASLAPLPAAADKQALATPKQSVFAQSEAKDTIVPVANNGSTSFIWPADGRIVSSFGPKPNGLVNDGINIEAAEGKPIWAAAGGEVVYAGNELKGYGNMLIIRHEGGWMTAYAHASDMLLKKGDHVKQGDLIGYVGKTGDVETAQLHFGIRKGKVPVNPESLLPRRVASVN